jgi:hypothetical protein
MMIEPSGATDAGGTSCPHQPYQIPFALLLVSSAREGDGRVSESDRVIRQGPNILKQETDERYA